MLARRGDPDTSHRAAEEIMEGDQLAALHTRVLALVRENPGNTARELAEIAGDRDIRTTGRRLHEIEKRGLISRGEPRPCSRTGKQAHVWFPTETKVT